LFIDSIRWPNRKSYTKITQCTATASDPFLKREKDEIILF